MFNAIDLIRANPSAKRYEIGENVFTRFTCPAQEEPFGIWSEHDHFVHVLSARSTWITTCGEVAADVGETVFFRKGALVMPPHYEADLCILIVFLSDSVVRETVRELTGQLAPLVDQAVPKEPAIRLNRDVTLSAFFASIAAYFAGDVSPPEALLKIKLKELLTGILVGRSNPGLSAYLRLSARHHAPSIPMIMEANFRYNLSLDAFARLCHRSLSTFKREFQKIYATTPKKWLLERRLDCAARLLHTPEMNVTEVAFECGFEDASHFCRVFKIKFGHPPSVNRSAVKVLA